MAGLPWYAHHIEKYLKKTAHLSMLQHGAYRLMLDHYYNTAEPLPAKLEQVQRVCRAFDEHEKAAVSAILNEFFYLAEDGWHNEPADEELAKMAELSEKRRNAAKNRVRTNKTETQDAAIDDAIDTTIAGANADANAGAIASAIAPTLNTNNISSLRSDIARSKKSKSSEPFVLPDWIPPEVWAAFMEVRKKRRAADTAYALNLIVKDLAKWRELGHDPTEILNKSIKSSWSDVYEPKENANGNRAEKRTSHDKFFNAAASYINDLGGSSEGGDDCASPLQISGPLLSP